METVVRWVLNLFFSSIFTFYASLLLLFLFRPLIKSPRALYIFYLLPLFKTAGDALFSSHKNWVFLSGESILKQPENSRTLSALIGYEGTYPFVSLKFHLENGHLFSIGDVISETLPPILSMGLFTLIVLGSSLALARLATKIYWSVRFSLRIKEGLIYWKTIKKVPVYLTHEPLHSPFILGFWKPMIVFPKKLASELTQEEKEAVLTHEIGHALWKDNLLQWIVLFIQAFFWFIPLKSKLFKKACYYRELGCDERCDQEALAGAIYKTGASTLPPVGVAFSTSFDRFEHALRRKQRGRKTIYLSFMILLGGGTLIFLSQFFPF